MNWTGFRIWLFSVLLNGIFFGIAALLYEEEKLWFVIGIGAAIGGLVLTAPLLLIIAPLVRISRKLPYETNARIIWLLSMLMLTGIVFLIAFEAILTGDFLNSSDKEYYELMISILLSVSLAVFFERNSLVRLYEMA